MSENALPEQFVDLEPLVDAWALETERERNYKRLTSTMEDIRAFYDALVPRAQAVLEYLKDYPCSDAPGNIEAVPDPQRRLLNLMLMLAEVAPAVETFGECAVIGGFESSRFIPEHDLPDWRINRLRGA